MRGVSLLELIVTVAVTALLVSILASVMIFQTRITFRTSRRAKADQLCRILYELVRRDCQQSGVTACTLGADQQSLALQPLITVSADAQPVYSDRELISYHYSGARKELQRRDWLPPPFALTPVPVRLTAGQWAQLGTGTAAQVRMFSGLEDFHVETSQSLPNQGADLRFRVKMETSTGMWTGMFTILLRNPA